MAIVQSLHNLDRQNMDHMVSVFQVLSHPSHMPMQFKTHFKWNLSPAIRTFRATLAATVVTAMAIGTFNVMSHCMDYVVQ